MISVLAIFSSFLRNSASTASGEIGGSFLLFFLGTRPLLTVSGGGFGENVVARGHRVATRLVVVVDAPVLDEPPGHHEDGGSGKEGDTCISARLAADEVS